jgi:HEAT repeat protein
MAAASIDINSNICRLVIDSVSIIKTFDENFSRIYLQKILSFLYSAYEELDKFIFRDKKYVINKQLFKLYWCLESLKLFVNEIDNDTLFKILNRAAKEKEYTIREKVAQILILTNEDKFIELKEQLKCDENYYVRTVFF